MRIAFFIVALLLALVPAAQAAESWPLTVLLRSPDGQAYQASSADLKLQIYTAETGGTAVATFSFPSHPLQGGVASVEIPQAGFATLPEGNLWVEWRLEDEGWVYPRQRVHSVPLAHRTPTDSTVLVYQDGKLAINAGALTPGDRIRLDASGEPVGDPVSASTAYRMQSLDTTGVSNLVGTLGPSDGGKTWFDQDTGGIYVWDGASAEALSTLAMQSINGSNQLDQQFAVDTSGNAPAWNTVGDTHTLSIPSASAGASVTRGTISGTDYANFTQKLGRNGGTLSGTVNMNGQALTNLPAPSNPSDAVRKTYFDTALATKQASIGYATVDKADPAMLGPLSLASHKVTGLLTGTDPADAVTKAAVDTGLATKQATIGYTTVDKNGDEMNDVLSMGGSRIARVPTPSDPTDLAPRSYVDDAISDYVHSGSDFTTSSAQRFVTDAEKTAWTTYAGYGDHATVGYLKSIPWNTPGAIGATTPQAGSFTQLTASPASAASGLIVTADAAQTSPLQEWRSSDGLLAAVEANGALGFRGNSQTVAVKAAPATANWTMRLPTSGGTNTYVLATDGSGETSWVVNDVTPPVPPVGFIEGMEIGYVSATQVSIGPGVGEINGVNWSTTSSTTHTLTSLAAGASWIYIYIDGTNSTFPNSVVFKDSTTAPSYSESKVGWYSGSDRCIGAVYNQGSSTIRPFRSMRKDRFVWDTPLTLLSNGLTADTWVTIAMSSYTPANTRAALLGWSHSDNTGSANGSTGLRSKAKPNFAWAIGHKYGYSNQVWFDLPAANRDLEYMTGGNDDVNMMVYMRGWQIAR